MYHQYFVHPKPPTDPQLFNLDILPYQTML
jgi:hypothetical protein